MTPGRTGRALAAVIVAALVLRLWNVDYPDWANVDEQHVIDRALLLARTGLNPEWFTNPSLFLYVLFALDATAYAAGRALGLLGFPDDFARFYFAHPLVFHLLGRALSLVAGIGALVAVFKLGREGWGAPVGLAAAALLAVSPVAVTMARAAKVDTLAMLLLVLGAWAALRYVRARAPVWLGAAALAVGLATSTKYTAGLGAVWLIAAPFVVEPAPAALGRAALAALVAGAAFLVGTPFAVLDWPTFSAYLGVLASNVDQGWYGAESRRGYTYYVSEALPRVFGWPAAALAVLGLLRWAAFGGTAGRLMAAAAGLFYALMGAARVAGESFLLPVLPLLALAAADLGRALLVRLDVTRRALGRVVVAIAAIACLAFPLTSSVRQTLLLAARDTREIAAEWIARHLPAGTRVVSEPYGPRVRIARGRLADIVEEEERRRPGHGMRTRFERDRARPDEGIWYHEMQLFSDRFGKQPAVEEYELDRFLRDGYAIIVLSSAVYDRYRPARDRHPRQNAFFERVVSRGRLLARFDPSTPWCCPASVNARLSEAAARRWGRPGPTLLIYRIDT